jgi:hypothetical protein
MPYTEAHGLVDGKVVAGSKLHDPQTGEWLEVEHVMSGRLPTAIDERVSARGPSSGERCAFYGGRKHWAEEG